MGDNRDTYNENSQPVGTTPVFGGATNQTQGQAQSMSGQAQIRNHSFIQSSPQSQADGLMGSHTAAKYFGGRSRQAQIASDAAQAQPNFGAGQNIASNSNIPQFFSDAVASNATISTEVPKKNKMKFFIIAGVAIVLIIFAVVAYLLMRNNAENHIVVDDKVIAAYNNYGNYIINGKELDSDFDVNTSIYDFAITKVSDSDMGNYVKKANMLYDNYYVMLNELKLPEDNDIYQLSQSYKGNLVLADFLYNRKMSNAEIFRLYMEKGLDSATLYIDSYYADEDIGSDYLSNVIAYQKSILAWLSYAGENECIVNGEYNITCAENLSGGEADSFASEQQKLLNAINDSEDVAISNMIGKVYEIKNKLRGVYE